MTGREFPSVENEDEWEGEFTKRKRTDANPHPLSHRGKKRGHTKCKNGTQSAITRTLHPPESTGMVVTPEGAQKTKEVPRVTSGDLVRVLTYT